MNKDDHSYLFWFTLGILVIGATLFATKVKAHYAMSGWLYPPDCCGSYDCEQVSDDAVYESASGFVLKASGEFIPRSSARVSGDEHYHLCRYPGPKIRCFFYPPRGF